jgi:hypothetical protein
MSAASGAALGTFACSFVSVIVRRLKSCGRSTRVFGSTRIARWWRKQGGTVARDRTVPRIGCTSCHSLVADLQAERARVDEVERLLTGDINDLHAELAGLDPNHPREKVVLALIGYASRVRSRLTGRP